MKERTASLKVNGVLKAYRHPDSRNVADKVSINLGIDVELPTNIKITVNREHRHINLAITMPPLEGGQDGVCGNFNSIGADDTIQMISRRDVRVAPDESLFPSI